MIKTLLSLQAIQYIYNDLVEECSKKDLPVQESLSEKQLEDIFGVIKSASNTVYGKKLYPSLFHQITFIIFQINKLHVLTDGNKRFSLMLALYILDAHKIKYSKMSTDDWEMLVMRIASDPKYSFDEALKYIKKKLG